MWVTARGRLRRGNDDNLLIPFSATLALQAAPGGGQGSAWTGKEESGPLRMGEVEGCRHRCGGAGADGDDFARAGQAGPGRHRSRRVAYSRPTGRPAQEERSGPAAERDRCP